MGYGTVWVAGSPPEPRGPLLTAPRLLAEPGLKDYGLQTMCEGGGMANATIIERLG